MIFNVILLLDKSNDITLVCIFINVVIYNIVLYISFIKLFNIFESSILLIAKHFLPKSLKLEPQ